MILGTVPFGFSEPLKVQLEQGLEINQIQCNNPNLILVERDNGNLACVYESTAEKLNWKIIPQSDTLNIDAKNSVNNLTLNEINYENIFTEINDMPKSFSSGSSSTVKYFEGSITLEKIPSLNEVTPFQITMEASSFLKENIDELLIETKEQFEQFPEKLPQYLTLQLSHPSSFNLEFSNTFDTEITIEQSGDVTYTIFKFPISLDKESILIQQEITGTLQPTQEGFFSLDLDQGYDYDIANSDNMITDTEINYTYLDDKSLYIDLTDSFEPEYFPRITEIDTTKELTVTGDYNIIEREVISRFSDELKSKVTFNEYGGIVLKDTSDKETIWQILDLFDEVYRDHPEFVRMATFEDMPDNPDMIIKMPKTQNFVSTFDYPENISNGDIFEITLNLESLDITNDYQQVEYLTLFGNGLHLVKEPTPYNDRDIENARNGIQCRGVYLQTDCIKGEPYTLPPKTVLVPNNLPNNHFLSITPYDNGKISYSVLVKALEKGDYMFKAIINDEVYRNRIIVN